MEIRLKPGRDKSVRMGHPWIFSGSIANVNGGIGDHRLCSVHSHGGDLLGCGYYNDNSAIRVRMLLSGGGKFGVDDLRERIQTSVSRRKLLTTGVTDSYRLVNSEGDFLPGLVVDQYKDGLCVQIGTMGMEAWRDDIVGILIDTLSPAFIYERSDTESREREGLPNSEGTIYGRVPDTLIITENGVKYKIDLNGGQKTGFYFDQRENRALLRQYSNGRRVCDCFSYTGGFAINAALGGAKTVCAVDTSADAGVRLSENARLNGVDINFIKADVFSFLRGMDPLPQSPQISQSSRSSKSTQTSRSLPDNKTDLLILDPPKFARHPKEADRAARGYKDINLAALKLLPPGGLLFTFSCSGAIDIRLFRQIIFAAAADSGRAVQILHSLSAGADHPVNIAHREGEYLKGHVLRVD